MQEIQDSDFILRNMDIDEDIEIQNILSQRTIKISCLSSEKEICAEFNISELQKAAIVCFC